MTNDNCTNAENKSVMQIDDTKNIPSQNVITEDEQPINGNPQEKSLELEIREISADRQALDRQISEKKKLLEDVNKQLKRVNKEYKKLRKSKGRTYFLCICLLTVIVVISVYREKQMIDNEKELKQQYFRDQYVDWEAQTIKAHNEKVRRENMSVYDRAKDEKRKQIGLFSDNNQDEINAYIASLDRVVDGVRSNAVDSVTCFTDTDVYELQNYTMTETSTTVFPGAVLKGESLFQGTVDYTLIPLERSPMYLVSDQMGGNSAKIEDVNYQGVIDFLNSCAVKNEGQAAKQWSYCMQVFRTSKELKASLGIDLPGAGGFGLDDSSHTETSSVAVVYKQLHYTVSAEPHKSAADYFQTDADMAVLGDYEPAYVSSVDYGRMVVVLIQGNMSLQELGAKVGACIKGVNISAGLTNIRMNSEITSQIYQYGGEQKDAGLITDTSEQKMGIVEKWNSIWNGSEDRETVENGINDFIQSDAPATNSVPIGYTLKYLTDNSFVPAMMVIGQESIVIPSEDIMKKVMITMESPVKWDISGMTGLQIAESEDSDSYLYEFLWDSNGADVLSGELDCENGKYINLHISEYLPEGSGHVDLGCFEYNGFSLQSIINETYHVYADVSITNY